MESKRLGKTRERLSCIGIGTWRIKNEKQSIDAIKLGIKNGVNLIDTAEMYGTERIVGRAIKGEKNVFIATKVWPTHFKNDSLIKACECSLKNLGVKQIDLYQLHWPNRFINIKETMKTMERLVYEGKIRYIGVSNFNKKELIKAQESLSKYDIVSNQVEYNMIARRPEIELMDYMKKERITMLAYSPFAHGAIFGRRYARLLKNVTEIGNKYEKTVGQIMLRWLIQKDIVIPLTKASTISHMKENIESSRFKINQRDLKYLDSLTPNTINNSFERFKPILEFYSGVISLFKR
ncbi:MAG: aldo/keto reductase [Candidatus Parvarchaeum acidophilus ARMAN-5]|jgi:diketogulonate reductase-like aldo/keto reductase|uniref:Aldo/keto reductase n=1 Tax=Candidatus Parvarchaeum acidophilus ARMAN-5 TaxID=662762 RepID=D6GVL1_PARA5|nr:MAG: aldo/keto reductase [Candidatus Parvarchaeum acidophilus ARMAN-5]